MGYSIGSSFVKKTEKLLNISGRKLLFYHNDADGICSAAMLLRFFPGFESDVRKGPIMDDRFVRDVVDKKPKLIVFLDLPVDQEWKKLEKMQKSLPDLSIVVIDHHLYEKNLNSGKILHINPRFKTDEYLPAAYLVYRLLKQIGKDVEPMLWVAAIGIIGDYGWDGCRELMDSCRRRYPKLLGQNPLNSKLGHAAELISYAVGLKGGLGARKSLDFMLRSKSFEDFIAVPELGGWKKDVDGEFDRITKLFEAEKEEFLHGIIAFKIDTRLGLNSAIANHFSQQYPDSIIIIRRLLGKGRNQQWKLSLRCQSGRVNVGELTKKAVKGIGTGGGHVKAAGATVNDWERFLKRFISYIS